MLFISHVSFGEFPRFAVTLALLLLPLPSLSAPDPVPGVYGQKKELCVPVWPRDVSVVCRQDHRVSHLQETSLQENHPL